MRADAAVSGKKAVKDPIVGLWLTQDHDAVVEIYACDTSICGRFHWMADDNGRMPRDENNHDAALRARPLCHMQFIGGFKDDGDGNYVDGTIYNPQDGWNYNVDMTLIDHDTLNLQGYILVPLLGRSQTWTRVEAYPSCKTDK